MSYEGIHIYPERITVCLLFIFSCVNSVMLIASTILVSLYLVYKNPNGSGQIKALLFITFRTVISQGLATGYELVSNFKWAVIIILSISTILFKKNVHNSTASIFIKLIIGFTLFVIALSLNNSDYPTVSIFRVISWALVFCAIIIGEKNNPKYNWVKEIVFYLNSIVLVSPLAVPLGIAYLRNGRGFQGIVNHPNMLGIIILLTFSLNLYLYQNDKKNTRIIIMLLSLIEGVLSQSRSGVLGIVLVFALHVFLTETSKKKKAIILFVLLCIIAWIIGGGLEKAITKFIYKGHESLLFSREGQINRYLDRFYSNRLFGSGFMAPSNNHIKNYSLLFELSVEPGNIGIMLIGDIGIIGTILFIIPFLFLLFNIDRTKLTLYFVPFVASLGEMMFFSTNNIAIVYYVIFAFCCITATKRGSAQESSLNEM